jgi:hypothetical protein
VAVQTYAPPAATGAFSAVFPDEAEVRVADTEDSDRLVAVIELVSPANKHDPAARRAFAGKCAAYLAQGVGLLIVDPVLNKPYNLHDELIHLLRRSEVLRMPPGTSIYATAYRPIRREDANQIDFWSVALAVGESLPTLPLALKGWGCIPIDLEATYMETRRHSRLP